MKSLNKVQLEILRQFEKCDSEEDLKQLQKMLINFLYQRAMRIAEKVDKEKGYTQETFQQWSKEHFGNIA